MAKTSTDDGPDPRDPAQDTTPAPRAGRTRKPMVRPELTRHGSLPEVTGAFIGTFSP